MPHTGSIENPLQFAATAVTETPKPDLSEVRQEFKDRRDILYLLLTSPGFRGELLEGGMLLTMRPPSDTIGRNPFQVSMQFLHEKPRRDRST
ncbi:MAG TPA: hypothetical protein DEP46_01060 [Blastocatellia bacterium]|nr:hypothetical protein [Blastocatellia bacterium]